MPTPPVDPVAFEIIRRRLAAINDEAAITVMRVSGSQVVTDAGDLNSVLERRHLVLREAEAQVVDRRRHRLAGEGGCVLCFGAAQHHIAVDPNADLALDPHEPWQPVAQGVVRHGQIGFGKKLVQVGVHEH